MPQNAQGRHVPNIVGWSTDSHRRPFFVPYNVARPKILDADLLSYRAAPWSISAQLIAIAGRGPDSHSACAAWDDGRLQSFGMRLWGPKQTTLSDDVRRHPGRIDVYRLAPRVTTPGVTLEIMGERNLYRLQRRAIVNTMRDFTLAGRYGWRNVLRSSLAFIPFARVFSRPSRDDQATRDRAPYCSQAYAHAVRLHFADLIHNRPDFDVLPAELTTSPLLHYLFTLAPAVPEAEAQPISAYLPPHHRRHGFYPEAA